MHNIPLEKIEQYLKDELSAQERLLFESELATDEELASAFNLYRKIEHEMRTGNDDTGKAALKDSLQQLGKTYFKRNETGDQQAVKPAAPIVSLDSSKQGVFKKDTKLKRISVWKQYAVAAAIIGVMSLSVIIYRQSQQKNYPVANTNKKPDSSADIIKRDSAQTHKNIIEENLAGQNKKDTNKAVKQKQQLHTTSNLEALFANNFKPDTIPESVAGPLEDALAYYENGDYKNAIASIETADLNMEFRGQETDTKHIIFYAHYYKALSYLAENRVEKAIPELNNAIKDSPDSILQIKAQWYLALAYLKSGDTEKAEKLLAKVVSNNGESTFKLKASTVLTDLKKQ
jgi:tetratricopeptide (TPR) repeat protein